MLNTPPHEKRAGPEVSFRSFMVPLPPLRDGGRALPIPSFRQTCLPLILDAPDCICSPGRLLLGVVQSGATAEWRHAQVISIHAPRMGCDADVPVGLYGGQISIHAPHAGCDRLRDVVLVDAEGISIHAPHAGCDVVVRQRRKVGADISIHAPHAGCDCCCTCRTPASMYFNPRTPCGVRLLRPARSSAWRRFQSTHPMRGATVCSANDVSGAVISIHAPHAGCDVKVALGEHQRRISIHAPHAGCDDDYTKAYARNSEFQSTHPMRGATICIDGL